MGGLPLSAEAATIERSEPVTVAALAVAQLQDGSLVGHAASVQAMVLADGSGDVFVDTKPLAQADMQGSARLAARVAAATLGVDWRQYDFLVTFRSESAVVGGPSAGAVMALAMTVALHNLVEPDDLWRVDDRVAATGTINPDGTIGPVGGIPQKAQGAADAGILRIFYPAGQDQFRAADSRGRVSTYTMDTHCDNLGITCGPAATLHDLLEGATGIALQRPDAPVPDTSRYVDLLVPSVPDQVAALQARIDAATAATDAVDRGSSATARERQAALETAHDRLRAARAFVENATYYSGATMAFQGGIWIGYVERLDAMQDAENAAATIEASVDACWDAASAAAAFAGGLTTRNLGDLYAHGSAQERARGALDLAAQAQASLDRARSIEDWHQALFQASFCLERVDTVTWWAGLASPGPVVDVGVLVADALGQATQLVGYAQAVVGAVPDAAASLQAAQAAADADRFPEAIFAAVAAQAQASIAVQTASAGLAPSVLDASRQGAADAVARARAQGVEPVPSVSMIELAEGLEPLDALENYWTARGLALLADGGVSPASDSPTAWDRVSATPSDEVARLYLIVGGLLGLAAGVAVASLGLLALRP